MCFEHCTTCWRNRCHRVHNRWLTSQTKSPTAFVAVIILQKRATSYATLQSVQFLVCSQNQMIIIQPWHWHRSNISSSFSAIHSSFNVNTLALYASWCIWMTHFPHSDFFTSHIFHHHTQSLHPFSAKHPTFRCWYPRNTVREQRNLPAMKISCFGIYFYLQIIIYNYFKIYAIQ